MCWLRPCGNTVPAGKESAEHACMEEDYKLLPLPLPLPLKLGRTYKSSTQKKGKHGDIFVSLKFSITQLKL